MLMYIFLWISWLLMGLLVGGTMSFMTRTRRRQWVDHLIAILGAFIGGFCYQLLKLPELTDFRLWSLIPAFFVALAFLSVFRWVNYREQPFGITKENVEAEKIQVVRDDLPAEEGIRDELSADAVPPADFVGKEKASQIRLGRIYFSPFIPLAIIVLLPILDFALLYSRYPSISSYPPLFGIVQTYSSEAGSLDYLVYTPSSYDESQSLPLLVMLHGCTQDPYMLDAASGMKNLADAQNFILVYPQQNNLRSPHRCWNWYARANQQRDSGEPALIVGIVHTIEEDYAVDSNRIYLAGFSSGAAMTSTLASCYPDVFAAAAIHSGMAYESARSEFEAILAPFMGSRTSPQEAGQDAYNCSAATNQTIPVLVFHGLADKTVLPENAVDTLEQFAQTNDWADDAADNDSINAEFTTGDVQQIEGGHSFTLINLHFNNQLLMKHYAVEGLGHSWSGDNGTPLSDPQGPNASEIFWNFFMQQPISP